MAAKTNNISKSFLHVSLFVGTLMGMWAVAAFFSGLAQVNWQFPQLIGHYLVAMGMIKEFHTFVDFYTHIKGVEYLIALFFLGVFPVFYKYLNGATSASPAAGE